MVRINRLIETVVVVDVSAAEVATDCVEDVLVEGFVDVAVD